MKFEQKSNFEVSMLQFLCNSTDVSFIFPFRIYIELE